jgi:hypothetical protein
LSEHILSWLNKHVLKNNKNMFKKLLSNLPFNPSLIGQVAFYSRRMREESSVRRTGLVFLVLAMVLQLFAVTSPPQPTLAGSSNDLLWDGFNTQAEAVGYCQANTQDFATILDYYRVSCGAVAAAGDTWIKSTDQGGGLDSLGRNPVANPSPRNGNNWDIYQVDVGLASLLTMKDLQYWDSYGSSSYHVLEVTNADNVTMWIMFDCGNIVTFGRYAPPPPPAPPVIPPPPVDACPLRPGFQNTTEECDACPNIPGNQNTSDECYPCPEARQDSSDNACLELWKGASNESQHIADANGTKAKAGDVILYKLFVKNKGSITMQDFVVEENLNDVLEYARVTNQHGGNLDSHNIIRWPAEDIAPGQTIEKHITVKVKDPIPQTPSPVSDPGSFDLLMTNVFYGSSVTIKLPQPPVKRIEQATKLPDTGPGTSLAIGFGLTAIVGYFFARSKLFATELEIVRDDFASGDVD